MSQVLPPIPEVAWVHDDYVAPPTFEDHEPAVNQPIALPPGPHIAISALAGIDEPEQTESAGDPPSGDPPGPPPVPVVNSVDPAGGAAAGGTVVTITGTGLDDATGIKFGATPAASFVADSPTSATATSPAHAAGVVHVTVTTAGGTSATSVDDEFTYA